MRTKRTWKKFETTEEQSTDGRKKKDLGYYRAAYYKQKSEIEKLANKNRSDLDDAALKVKSLQSTINTLANQNRDLDCRIVELNKIIRLYDVVFEELTRRETGKMTVSSNPQWNGANSNGTTHSN